MPLASAVLLGVYTTAAATVVGITVRHYASTTWVLTHWAIQGQLFIALFTAFFPIALLAVDIHCAVAQNIVPGVIAIAWDVVFWAVTILAWLVLPVCQSYSEAGDFTPRKRLRTAVQQNLLFYAVLGVVCGVILGFYAYFFGGLPSASGLQSLTFAASNAFGITITMLLLGCQASPLPLLDSDWLKPRADCCGEAIWSACASVWHAVRTASTRQLTLPNTTGKSCSCTGKREPRSRTRTRRSTLRRFEKRLPCLGKACRPITAGTCRKRQRMPFARCRRTWLASTEK
eukprot:TRINITY_DN17217_c0_g1_i1.p1 TRINITY_DN17217_c0_g1~~TRINITY_DN17217_c0_g1_i1.p1  ORF type:complete len:287 (+),score=10.41 TRINITY_DN17217_c0_g1_i1:23-883(+)